MKIPVHLYSNLQLYSGNQNVVDTQGSSVGECLIHLIQKYPDIGPVILDKSGEISPQVYVSINLESAKSETMQRLLNDGDRIYLILIVAGG